MEQRRIGKHISIAYRYAMSFFRIEMSKFNLNPSHHFILFALYRHDGISQESLSKELHVDKATITRSIKSLLSEGFIERRQDPNDKRSYMIFLTPKAMEIKPKVHEMFSKWNDIILEGLTEEEVDMAYTLLKKISTNALRHHGCAEMTAHCPIAKESPHE